MQYDLLRHGLTLEALGSEAFTWYDLAVMVRYLQRDPASALGAEIHGRMWSVEAQLLAGAADLLAHGNWQRQQKKHAPKPKRIPRPWDKPKTHQFGSDPIPISQFDEWWESAAKRKAG